MKSRNQTIESKETDAKSLLIIIDCGLASEFS